MKLAQGSKSWILTPLLFGIIFFMIYIYVNYGSIFLIISILLFIVSGFFIIFFRDPDRKIGNGVVACADGIIQNISDDDVDSVGKCIKISIFMNIYNVHVNRMPFAGEVTEINYIPGSHVPAFNKESERNERLEILVKTKIGMIKIVQIAGIFARRIVSYIKVGDFINKGEKIGLIRFGSRVDVYLPKKYDKSIIVLKGDRVKAGEDEIAKIGC